MPKISVDNPNFSGHETFCFRYGWLKKGFDAVLQDPLVFSCEDAIVKLGVGKNMVRSIRHWCLATGIIEEPSGSDRQKIASPTEIGRFIFADDGADPFLEDPGTLWVLHWLLARNESMATTWYYAFSHWTMPEFTKESLSMALLKSLRENELRAPAEASIRRDVDCFVKTYVRSRSRSDAPLEDSFDCPLVELNLIVGSTDNKTYYFNRGDHASIAPLILAYMIMDFWKPTASNQSLTYEQLAYSPGSPGRLLRLDDNSFSDKLYALEKATNGVFIYSENSGLMQLYCKDLHLPAIEFLKEYYALKGAKLVS
jgi:hypothetical protein